MIVDAGRVLSSLRNGSLVSTALTLPFRWTAAMADLAGRRGSAVTAADMRAMCRARDFDAAFVSFAAKALGLSDHEV
jgi:predicted benzoate:H+ symporter BenE